MKKILSAVAMLEGVLILITGATVFGANEKVLFGVDSGCDCLYIINTSTGDTFPIGELGASGRFDTPTSMAVDLDGTLFTVNNSTGELLTIDRATGKAKVVGDRW